MHRVGHWWGQNDFRVTCYVNDSLHSGSVSNPNAPKLNIIFRRNDNFGVCIEIAITPTKFGASLGKNSFVVLGSFNGWLMSSRPTGMARHIADVAERSPIITSGIFTPTCNRKIFPAAITSTRIGYHHMVSAVR